MKTDLFQFCGHCWVFQIFWHIECSTLTAPSLRVWNSSTRISSPPLALFVVMLPKAHLTSHFRISVYRWVITPSYLPGSWRATHWNIETEFHLWTPVQFSSVQLLSCVQLFASPRTAAHQASCSSPTPGVFSNSCPMRWWCHPNISSPSPPAFNLSQHQGLFLWVSSLHQVAKVLEFQLQHQSFQWIFRTDFL